MADSTILRITQVAENQASKHIVINDAVSALERSINDILDIDYAAITTNEVIIEDMLRYGVFVTLNTTSASDLIFPSLVSLTDETKRIINVYNPSTFDVTVMMDDTGETVVVPAARSATLLLRGVDVISLGSASGGGGSSAGAFSIALYFPELPNENETALSYTFVESVTFANNFANSRARIEVNPTSAITFSFSKNGTLAGTLSFSTSGVATFATVSGAISFVANDRLTVQTPDPQDATASGINFTLLGTR